MYTKGKWYWTVDEEGRPLHLRCALEDDSGTKHILFTSDDFMGNYAFENAQANANLIAAAPDMYEALKDLAACFRNIDVLLSIQDDNERWLLGIAHDTMNKALAKVDGK